MIRRLAQVRLRLIDAVALAAIAVLALKIVGLLAAPPVRAPSGSNGPGEQISGFFRAAANARTNYVPPDVTMTGAVPDKKAEDTKPEATVTSEDSADEAASYRVPRSADLSGRARRARKARRAARGDRKGRAREMDTREALLRAAENLKLPLDGRVTDLTGRSRESCRATSTIASRAQSSAIKNSRHDV